jgi:hypothetical protein
VSSATAFWRVCPVIIDECFASTGGGDERGGGSILQRARQAEAGLVQAGDRVVREELVGPTNQAQVVTQVGSRFGQVPRRQVIAGSDALVEGSEDAHVELAG